MKTYILSTQKNLETVLFSSQNMLNMKGKKSINNFRLK